MPPTSPDAAPGPKTAFERGRVVADLLRGALGNAQPNRPPMAVVREMMPWMVRSGLAPLLWWRLRRDAGTDEHWLRSLREFYVAQAVRTMQVDADLARLWPILEDAGVTPLLGKGPVVALAYPDRVLRPFSDLDVYVPESQFARTHALLGHARLRHIIVDLHRGASHVSDIPFERLRECADTIRIGDTDVRVMSKPHHLRLVALHALNEGVIRPLWLVDVACLLRRDAVTLDWTMFNEGAAWGARGPRTGARRARREDVARGVRHPAGTGLGRGRRASHLGPATAVEGLAPGHGLARSKRARLARGPAGAMANSHRSGGRRGDDGAAARGGRAPGSRVRQASAGVRLRQVRAGWQRVRLKPDTT